MGVMMRRRLRLCAAAALLLPAAALAAPAGTVSAPRAVAVTFDDLPIASSRGRESEALESLTIRLLSVVEREAIPAVGFVNGNKLRRNGKIDEERVGLLRRWLDLGLELGNHTYSHPDLHRVPLEEFQEDVLQGEPLIRELMSGANRELRYFRHPYLHTGRELETREALETFLAEHGYRVAPVTIDNSDWIFAKAYDLALEEGDEDGRLRIAEAYVPYMEGYLAYYEQQSRALLGREIPQVLLLHVSTLNADLLDELAAMIRGRGYEWVTLDQALADDAYGSPDRYVGKAGISWLHRWAITVGKRGDFFKGEPTVPGFVLERAGVAAP